MCTIFRSENTFTSYEQAVELRDVTGLSLPQCVVFRPERMVLHEVLVRVIADYEVPDPEGADVRSLGVNFRNMTRAILRRHVMPQMDSLTGEYAPIRDAVCELVAKELALAFGRDLDPLQKRTAPPRRGLFARFRRPPPSRLADEEPWVREDRVLRHWQARAQGEGMEPAAFRALTRVVSAIRALNGGLWGSPDVLAPLVAGLACNDYGGQLIADRVGPLIAEAATAEHFRPLPSQERPIAMTTKGASAAGKSTMRPMQRSLAARMGATWSDFALISPDIFRRDLLDIDSLGPHYKYFGAFTSHELEIVDQKLDRYLALKADLHATPHLLVDRFRFDSFASDPDEQKQLLARLGKRRLLHYLFMITPPEKTVERAWKRGLEIGRYKPVDDLLAHNVEAYAGMQSFFLTRALRSAGLNQHYEFLDNDVPLGEIPLTVAFGWNGELNIVDVKCLVDMDRYCRINVDARRPEEVYANTLSLDVKSNVAFLRTCVHQFPVLNFAQRETGRIYAHFESGRLAWKDPAAVDTIDDPVTLTALNAVAPDVFAHIVTTPIKSDRYLDPARFLTLGRWGPPTDRTASAPAG